MASNEASTTTDDSGAAGQQGPAGGGGSGGVSQGLESDPLDDNTGESSLGGQPAQIPPAGAGGSTDTGPSSPTLPSRNAMALTQRGGCALDSLGEIHCWGYEPEQWSIPTGSFTKLLTNAFAVCAIREDGQLVCFSAPGEEMQSPLLSNLDGIHAQDAALGFEVLCGIDLEGDLFCNWADERFALPLPSDVLLTRVSVGTLFACGIRESDSGIQCWGTAGDPSEIEGFCGYAPQEGQRESPPGRFLDIASGYHSSCALREDGSLACWGAGESDDDPNAVCGAAMVNQGQSAPPPGSYDSVAVDLNHSCAVRSDKTLACWGAGATDECTGDDCRQSLPPSGEFELVAVGTWHSCAMRADRTISCWGYDGDGDGRTTPPVLR